MREILKHELSYVSGAGDVIYMNGTTKVTERLDENNNWIATTYEHADGSGRYFGNDGTNITWNSTVSSSGSIDAFCGGISAFGVFSEFCTAFSEGIYGYVGGFTVPQGEVLPEIEIRNSADLSGVVVDPTHLGVGVTNQDVNRVLEQIRLDAAAVGNWALESWMRTNFPGTSSIVYDDKLPEFEPTPR